MLVSSPAGGLVVAPGVEMVVQLIVIFLVADVVVGTKCPASDVTPVGTTVVTSEVEVVDPTPPVLGVAFVGIISTVAGVVALGTSLLVSDEVPGDAMLPEMVPVGVVIVDSDVIEDLMVLLVSKVMAGSKLVFV